MWSSMVDGSSGRHLIYPFYYHLRWHRIWLYSSHYGALGKRKKKGVMDVGSVMAGSTSVFAAWKWRCT